MTTRLDPFGTALSRLRAWMANGRFLPGESLCIQDLAAEIGLSITPVREALACLAGEGVVVRRPGKGYVFPDLPPAEILDLYEAQIGFARVALSLLADKGHALQKAATRMGGAGMAEVIDFVVDQAANDALDAAYGRLKGRLKRLHEAEENLFGADLAQGAACLAALARGATAEAAVLIDEHHSRRVARAVDLADACRA